MFGWVTETALVIAIGIFVIAVGIWTINDLLRKEEDKAIYPVYVALILGGLMVVFIFEFAAVYASIGMIHNGKEVHDFKSALYFSVVTWTTLGYGDFQPVEAARKIAALQALLGYMFMALFMGITIYILSRSFDVRLDKGKKEGEEKRV